MGSQNGVEQFEGTELWVMNVAMDTGHSFLRLTAETGRSARCCLRGVRVIWRWCRLRATILYDEMRFNTIH